MHIVEFTVFPNFVMQLTMAINVLFSTNFVNFLTKKIGKFLDLLFNVLFSPNFLYIYKCRVGWEGKHPNGNNP